MTLENPGPGPGLERGPPTPFGAGPDRGSGFPEKQEPGWGPGQRGWRLTLHLPELWVAWRAGQLPAVEVEGPGGEGLGGEGIGEAQGVPSVTWKEPGQLQLEWDEDPGVRAGKRGPRPDWQGEFEAFHTRFAPLFVRREPREQAAKYLRGLLGRVDRKNGWQLAEEIGDAGPDKTQRLLYQAGWDADAVRDELQRFVIERFGHEDGVGVVDESGFLKKGTKSVGVQRQYTGTAGKIANCQIGVFLTYASPHGSTFLDRRLYLPQEWCADPARCREAKVPPEIEFRTKPQWAGEMLEQAWKLGVPMRWVTGDEVYGNAPALRDLIAGAGRFYVLAVAANTPVWTARPVVEGPQQETGGRPRTHPRLAPEASPASEVRQVIAALPASEWVRLTVQEGEKGPITYDWAWVRVVESRDGLPGPEAWLLARRSVTDPTEISYYLSNAPEDTPGPKLAEVASVRHTIEQCLEEGKGEAGLDEYEVRHWPSWHRHITLSMMAHAWLASLRQQENGKPQDPELAEWTVPEVRRLLEVALPLPPRSVAFRWAWSDWRRRRRQQARCSHYRRTLGRHQNAAPS